MTQTEASDRERNTERDRDTASQGPRPRAITGQTGEGQALPATLRSTHRDRTQESGSQAQVSGRLVSAQTESSSRVYCVEDLLRMKAQGMSSRVLIL